MDHQLTTATDSNLPPTLVTDACPRDDSLPLTKEAWVEQILEERRAKIKEVMESDALCRGLTALITKNVRDENRKYMKAKAAERSQPN